MANPARLHTGQTVDRVKLLFDLAKGGLAPLRGKMTSTRNGTSRLLPSPSNLLLIFLWWLWRYPSDDEIAAEFDLAPWTVRDLRRNVAAVCATAWAPLIIFPADPRHRHRIGTGPFAGVTFVFDTFNFEMPKSKIDSWIRRLFAPKSSTKQAWKAQTTVDLAGQIVDFAGPFVGSTADITILRGSAVFQRLTATALGLGDAAYRGELFVRACKVKPPHGELSKEDDAYNKQLHQVRAIVENAHSRVRAFRVANTTWRGETTDELHIGHVMRCVYQLAVLWIREEPLRKNPHHITHPKPHVDDE
jgi:hypothetical protein